MAYPAYRTSSQGAVLSLASTQTGSVPAPVGVTTGDLIVMVIISQQGGNDPTLPAGFTLQEKIATQSGFSGIQVCWKIAGASEPSGYSITASGATALIAQTYAFTGAHQTIPFNVSAQAIAFKPGTSVPIPDLTTTAATCLLLGLVYSYASTSNTYTAGSGFTLVGQGAQSGSSQMSYGLESKQVATASGVTGSTMTTNATASFFGLTFAIQPPAGGSTPVAFTPTVPTQNLTVGSAASIPLASYFSGTLTPFAYTSGALPVGLTLSSSTGTISGTPTATGTTAVIVTATDTGANTAATNSFNIVVAAAPTGPTLTSPLGTATGSTTASGGVTTTGADGTLYALASTNATESAATVKASPLIQAITSTGAKTVSFTGLTASTVYYAHYVHRSAAGNDSAVSDTPSSFTTTAAGSGTITGEVIKNNTGTPLVSLAIPKVAYIRLSDMANVLTLASQTTNASGFLPITNAALVTGVAYIRLLSDATGANIGAKVFTST